MSSRLGCYYSRYIKHIRVSHRTTTRSHTWTAQTIDSYAFCSSNSKPKKISCLVQIRKLSTLFESKLKNKGIYKEPLFLRKFRQNARILVGIGAFSVVQSKSPVGLKSDFSKNFPAFPRNFLEIFTQKEFLTSTVFCRLTNFFTVSGIVERATSTEAYHQDLG